MDLVCLSRKVGKKRHYIFVTKLIFASETIFLYFFKFILNFSYTPVTMVKGYVYCLSNPSFPKNTHKIGFTTKPPTRRALELFQTGLPTPFKIEFSKKVKDCRETESRLHCYFRKQRINEDREFFDVPLAKIRFQFQKTKGVWWYEATTPESSSNDLSVDMVFPIDSWALRQRRLRRKCKKRA